VVVEPAPYSVALIGLASARDEMEADRLMNRKMKKLIRTSQIYFPYLQEAKYVLQKSFRNTLRVPFASAFNGLSLFPHADEALFLDVGANRGQSADAILMKTKRCRIHLIEPNPLLCESLKRLYGNNDRVVIHNCGLGDKTTEQDLYIPCYRNWMFDGLASFDEAHPIDWLKKGIYFHRERHLVLHKFKCSIRRLDELKLDPFFIKFDMLGGYIQSLKGGEETIKKYEPILLIGRPGERAANYLKSFGYQPYAFKKGKFMPYINDTNLFFMTPDKSSLVISHIERDRSSLFRTRAARDGDARAHARV